MKKAQELLRALRQLRGKKVVTLSLQTDDAVSADYVFDIDEAGYIGYHSHHKRQFLTLLEHGLLNGGGMIVRNYSKLSYWIETEDGSSEQVPYKRVFALLLRDGDYYPLSKEETQQVCCYDADTGRAIPREAGVIYSSFDQIGSPSQVRGL